MSACFMKFQYRKRYELHAMLCWQFVKFASLRFNTASGMNCMQFIHCAGSMLLEVFQYRKRYELHAIKSCRFFRCDALVFQYRKRYELHAIPHEGGVSIEIFVSIPQAV